MDFCTRTFLVVFLLTWAAGPTFATTDSEQVTDDEKLLRSAHLGIDGPDLLDFFHKRAAGTADPARIAVLVQQLADTRAAVAEHAAAELVAVAPTVVPVLRQTLKNKPQGDHVARIEKCLRWLEDWQRFAIPAAAARLLATRKPMGAAAALLAYFPTAEAEGTGSDIRAALAEVALRGGKVDPALAAALADKNPLCRGLAAETLAQVGGWEQRTTILPLLNDPDSGVRLGTAIGLASIHEQQAIPVLIALLEELPQDAGWQAEGILLQLAGSQAPAASLGSDEAGRKKCRDAWESWWKTSEGSVVLDYFRRRTLSDANQEKVAGLIRSLDHTAYVVREKATADLLAMRRLAVPLLKEALRNPATELQRRSRYCLERIAQAVEAPQVIVNVRLLALRHPAEATAILLAYLPFADDDSVEEEIRTALRSLVQMDNAARIALLARLDDKFPQRRAAAAEVLAQFGSAEQRLAVRNRLQDAAPVVRLRVALALATQKEREAIPVLIALLAEPQEQARQAEEILLQLADTQAPAVPLGVDAAARQKCRDAWANWWQANAGKVDLARLQARCHLLGYTVMARWDYKSQTNELVELGRNGEIRWKIENLGYSFDFQMLPGSRILMVENLRGCVCERNLRGDVLWEYKVNSPHNCQRLFNGNTFIATGNEVLEVDRTGKVLYSIARPNMSAVKLSDGRIVTLQSAGDCTWIDTKGNELKTVNFGGSVNSYGGMIALSNGGVLLALDGQGKVLELNATGKIHWQVALKSPFMATRLRSGNTLVTSQEEKYAVEVDWTGRVVWEHRPGMGIWRAHRR